MKRGKWTGIGDWCGIREAEEKQKERKVKGVLGGGSARVHGKNLILAVLVE